MPVRELLTRFRADTRNFDRGTRRINDNLRRLERTTDRRMGAIEQRMRRAGRAFTGAIGAFATIAGARALTQGIRRAADQLDNIAKQADKLGVTTDALQELRVAAELSGVEIRTFDLAFQRFTRRAAEAANGTGEAKAALEELGIQLRDTGGNIRPTEQLLRDVADAFTAVENPADRVRLAFKLFDSEGVSVINMLQRGGNALDEMRQQARELGVVFEEDLIRETVRLKDELTLLERQIDADTTRAMVNMAPVIRDLGELLVWLTERAAQAHEGFRRLFSGELRQSIADIGIREELEAARADLEALDAEFRRLTETGQSDLGARLGIFPEEGEDPDQRLDRFNRTLDAFAERRSELVERIESLQARLGRVLGEVGGAEEVAPDVPPAPPLPTAPGGAGGGALSAEATAERESALAQELRTLAERTAELRRMLEIQKALDPEMKGYQTALRAAEIEARLLARAEAENVEVTAELADRIRDVAQAYAQAEGEVDRLRERQDEIGQGRRIIDDLAFGLENAITQARSLEEALQNVAFALANIAIQQLQQPGGGILGSIFGSIFGGGSGGFTSSGQGRIPVGFAHRGGVIGRDSFPTRSVPDFVFAGAPRMHGGGIAGLRPNEVPAILEKGEIVVPKNLGAAGGGGNVTVEGSTIVLQGSQATPEELQRVLDKRDRELIGKIQRLWVSDPNAFPQS